MDLRREVIRLAYKHPQLRGDLLPLLRGRSIQAATVSVEQALKLKELRLSDLEPKDKKADLAYFKKVRVWRIQQSHKALQGKVPEDKLQKFLEENANGYAVKMYEEDRGKWPKSEDVIYQQLVDPKSQNNSLWPQMRSYLQHYGVSAQNLKPQAAKLLKEKSDLQILEAGIRASIIRDYDYKKLLDRVRDVDSLDEESLGLLISALQKV